LVSRQYPQGNSDRNGFSRGHQAPQEHHSGQIHQALATAMTRGRWVIVSGCAYEIVALVTDRVPTITAIVKMSGRFRYGRLILWLWLGFIVDHFIEREAVAIVDAMP